MSKIASEAGKGILSRGNGIGKSTDNQILRELSNSLVWLDYKMHDESIERYG